MDLSDGWYSILKAGGFACYECGDDRELVSDDVWAVVGDGGVMYERSEWGVVGHFLAFRRSVVLMDDGSVHTGWRYKGRGQRRCSRFMSMSKVVDFYQLLGFEFCVLKAIPDYYLMALGKSREEWLLWLGKLGIDVETKVVILNLAKWKNRKEVRELYHCVKRKSY